MSLEPCFSLLTTSRHYKPLEKVTSLGCLKSHLPDLASSSDMDLIHTLDNYVHRLCGFQQVIKYILFIAKACESLFFC